MDEPEGEKPPVEGESQKTITLPDGQVVDAELHKATLHDMERMLESMRENIRRERERKTGGG